MTQTPKSQNVRQPLGKPIEWSDEQLDALSQISDADLLLAVELWKRANLISGLRDLLEAEPDTQGGNSSPYGRF